uniref:non-specific serine/threonine protein kinase n=2 Tax=Caenorhabditis tropicalis TaxID=1561998 RepID=A0A1I7TL59_9PELO
MASTNAKNSTQPFSSKQQDTHGISDSTFHEENNQMVIAIAERTKVREEQYSEGGFFRANPGHLINDYELLKYLSRGGYGTVWLAKRTQTDIYSAMKISKSSIGYEEYSKREIEILKKIQTPTSHPNIVKLLDSFYMEGDNVKHMVMVFEVLGPTLESVIFSSGQKIHLEVVKSITRQLLEAINYIHNLNLVHMDIKPANVMLAINENDIKHLASNQDLTCNRYSIDVTNPNAIIVAKLADFGLAFYTDEKLPSHPTSSCFFRAPEQFLTTKYDTALDMWSFGCLIHEMIAASNLFACKKYRSVPNHNSCHFMLMDHLFGPIKRADFQDGLRREFSQQFDRDGHMVVPYLNEFLPNFYKTAVHNGMKEEEAEEYSNFLHLFFKYNRAERITAGEALQHAFLLPNRVKRLDKNGQEETAAVPVLDLKNPETNNEEEFDRVFQFHNADKN